MVEDYKMGTHTIITTTIISHTITNTLWNCVNHWQQTFRSEAKKCTHTYAHFNLHSYTYAQTHALTHSYIHTYIHIHACGCIECFLRFSYLARFFLTRSIPLWFTSADAVAAIFSFFISYEWNDVDAYKYLLPFLFFESAYIF